MPFSLRSGRVLAAAALVLILCAFYWKILFTNQYVWPQGGDMVNMRLPFYQFQAREMHAGRFPLWDPHQLGGQPFTGQMVTASFSPVHLLLYSLPLRDGHIRTGFVQWFFVFIHLLAAAAAYRLAREMECRRGPAVLAGLIYSLGGFLAEFDWPDVMTGAVWAPLVVLYLMRAARGVRVVESGVFGGFFLGLAWLSGHHQVPFLLCLVAAGFWIFAAVRQGPGKTWLAGAALFAAVSLAVGAVQIIPALEYGRYAVRWVGTPDPIAWGQKIPYDVHAHYAFRPAGLLNLVFPRFTVNVSVYLGITALALAALGLLLNWARAEIRWLAALAALALLYSMAGYNLFNGLLYALLPLAEKVRNPSFAMLFFHLSAAVLAALGLQRAACGELPPGSRRLAMRLLFAFAALIFAVRIGIHVATGFSHQYDDRPIFSAVTALLAAAVLANAPRARAHTVVALFTGLFLLDAGLNHTFHWPSRQDKAHVYPERLNSHAGLAAFLKTRAGLSRVRRDEARVPYNFGDWFGVQEIGGHLGSITSNLYRHARHMPGFRRLMGVEYAVLPEPTPEFPEVLFRAESGLKVCRNPAAFPRAYAVHQAVKLDDRRLTEQWMEDPERDWRRAVFLSGDPPTLAVCAGEEQVEIAGYTPNLVRLKARLACRGLVVLTDVYYPGWSATVDGRPAAIIEAYGLVRAVVVEAGAHEIVFRYRPWSVFMGLYLTAAGLLVCLFFTARRIRLR